MGWQQDERSQVGLQHIDMRMVCMHNDANASQWIMSAASASWPPRKGLMQASCCASVSATCCKQTSMQPLLIRLA